MWYKFLVIIFRYRDLLEPMTLVKTFRGIVGYLNMKVNGVDLGFVMRGGRRDDLLQALRAQTSRAIGLLRRQVCVSLVLKFDNLQQGHP